MRWQVFTWDGDSWVTGPVLPEGAAQHYVESRRMVLAYCLEALGG